MDDSGLRYRDRHINRPGCRGRVRHRTDASWRSTEGSLRTRSLDRVGDHARRGGTVDQVHTQWPVTSGQLAEKGMVLARPVPTVQSPVALPLTTDHWPLATV